MDTILNRRFFVVIHTMNAAMGGLGHVLSETVVARDNGADGVILIPDYAKGSDNKATVEDQLTYLGAAKKTFPDFLIGANFLTKFSGLKEDLYRLQPALLQTDGSSLGGLKREKLPNTEFFCGVAFKYSRYENLQGEELYRHCSHVASICQVPTTSGKATGQAAKINKVEEIALYLPKGKRLGLASGVTQDNVQAYLRAGVTDFLVASSLVTRDEFGRDILIPERVANLAAAIHAEIL